jgi:hypothetical protein
VAKQFLKEKKKNRTAGNIQRQKKIMFVVILNQPFCPNSQLNFCTKRLQSGYIDQRVSSKYFHAHIQKIKNKSSGCIYVQNIKVSISV